jgi:hypothetical protein
MTAGRRSDFPGCLFTLGQPAWPHPQKSLGFLAKLMYEV